MRLVSVLSVWRRWLAANSTWHESALRRTRRAKSSRATAFLGCRGESSFLARVPSRRARKTAPVGASERDREGSRRTSTVEPKQGVRRCRGKFRTRTSWRSGESLARPYPQPLEATAGSCPVLPERKLRHCARAAAPTFELAPSRSEVADLFFASARARLFSVWSRRALANYLQVQRLRKPAA